MPAKYRSFMLDNDFRALAAAQQDRASQAAAITKMTMPCLMFAGRAGPMYDEAKSAAGQIANCRFFTVGELDHGATFRESVQVLPEVRAFLAMT
jgi:hypothetical protein